VGIYEAESDFENNQDRQVPQYTHHY
jgi:hypothetical protein